MKIRWKTLLVCLAIPLIVGGIAGFISKDSMQIFEELNKPPLSPPGWIFPVVWTILYAGMGIACYLVIMASASQSINNAIKLYGVQLVFNFLWTLWFFNAGLYLFSFFWLIALLLLIIATLLRFGKISRPAMYLMIPYALWVAFAGYLNLGVALLNK